MSSLEDLRIALKLKQDPTWFIEEKLGIPMFPNQKSIMQEFYAGPYRVLVLMCGMRGGKSVLGAFFTVVEFATLLVLPDPQMYYRLIKSQPIHISVVSTSEDQALDSIFANVRTIIEDDKTFFSSYDLSIRDTIIKDKSRNLVTKTLSSWSTTAIGRSNIAVILDELASFEQTSGRRGAFEIYTRLRKSTDTFKQDGKTIAISSTQHANDIIMTLFNRDDPTSLRKKIPTWEMNPNYTEQQLREEHKYDLAAFYRDYACEPGTLTGVEFPTGVTLNKDLINVLRYPAQAQHISRILAIDPAVKDDAFGIAVGYLDTRTNKIVIDGVHRFIKESGSPFISPTEVREKLTHVIKELGITTTIFDVWMYPELIEFIESMGIPCVKHIVGKQDYDRWKELDSSKLVDVTYDEVLKIETDQLQIVSERKVNHPNQGSKDLADCVANVIWYLATEDIKTFMPPVCVAF